MDHFMEEVIIRKNRAMQDMLYYLANVTMVLCAIIGFWMLSNIFSSFSVMALIVTVVFCGLAVLLYLYKDRLRAEYEYTFTNGDLDFAQVFNNSKRKSLGTMRVKNVEGFGPVNSDQFRKMVNMPGIKRKNWFLNRGAQLYYFYYQKDSSRMMIVLEPSRELVEMIKRYLPHGVFHA
jgi:hypothetical protein